MGMDLSKYKFFRTKNKIIAVSTYAGRTVRGVAKCSPNDTFNLQKGKELAAARCNYKIAEKRAARACAKRADAIKALTDAENFLRNMTDYKNNSVKALVEANNKLTELETAMKF